MYTPMDTLDHAIRERITAHLKRAGVSGRRFGLDALGDPCFVASFERGTSLDAGDEPARPRMRSSPFRSAHGDGCRCPGPRAGPARRDAGNGHKPALRLRRWPIHDLRCLDDFILEGKRPFSVESEDECGRDGHGMDAGKKYCAVANLRRQRTGEVWRGPERSGGVLSIPNHL